MKWVALGLAALAILVVAWLAVEVRYSACVQASPYEFKYETSSSLRGSGGDRGFSPFNDSARWNGTAEGSGQGSASRDISECWHP
jgi:hypothetical protein